MPDLAATSTHDQFTRLEHNLTNHPPANDTVIERFESLREDAKFLGASIIVLCPNSREKALALTNLEQTVMWAVAAIARNQEGIGE